MTQPKTEVEAKRKRSTLSSRNSQSVPLKNEVEEQVARGIRNAFLTL